MSGRSPRHSNPNPTFPVSANLATLIDKFRASAVSFSVVGGEEEEQTNTILDEEQSYKTEDSIVNATFSRLHVAIFTSAIEEALDKLKILGCIGGLPKVSVNLEYQTLAHKYEKEETQSFIFDPETLEAYEGSTKKQMLIKFQKDRSYIEQILEEANQNLLTTQTLHQFLARLKEFCVVEEEKDKLLAENSQNIAELHNLTLQIEKDKINLQSDLQKKSEKLGKLKDQYEDLVYENDIKYSYIDKWENARCTQNKVDLNKKEDYFANIITEFRSNYEVENRINSEIETYLTEMDGKYRDSLEYWVDKYDSDMDSKDIDIQCMKEKRDVLTTKLENLMKLYNKHKVEIEEYLVQKEERRKQEELLRQRTAAAIKIQSWWRGVMYRKGLGPYRKKKKKGKGKDKKGKRR